MKKGSSSSSARKVLRTSTGFEESDSDDEGGVQKAKDQHEDDIEKCLEFKDEGCELAESGDYNGALNAWHRALQLDPNNYVVYELRAQAYLELEMYLLAMQSSEKAIELNPNWGVGYHTLARCQREGGEICLSLQNYKTAATMMPNDAEVRAEMEEVSGLSSQLHQLRLERYQALQLSDKNSPAHEANSCIYHLSARATGLITSSQAQKMDEDK